jgi:miniconductance mechanosensitive channel
MADIFDHLIAAVPYFNLEIFELPSNSSFTDWTKSTVHAIESNNQ